MISVPRSIIVAISVALMCGLLAYSGAISTSRAPTIMAPIVHRTNTTAEILRYFHDEILVLARNHSESRERKEAKQQSIDIRTAYPSSVAEYRKWVCNQDYGRMNNPRVAVVSAISGGMDNTPSLVLSEKEENVDYFMFIDELPPPDPNSLWKFVVLDFPHRDYHPRLRAKYIKAQAHRAVPGYDVYIWADGQYSVRKGHAKFFLDHLGDNGQICYGRHHERSTIAAEAEVSKNPHDGYLVARYGNEMIKEQVAHYFAEGFKDDRGLYAGGLFGYRNSPCARAFYDQWWMENVRWSIQDQISLPYLMHIFDLTPMIFDNPGYSTPYAQIGGHAKLQL